MYPWLKVSLANLRLFFFVLEGSIRLKIKVIPFVLENADTCLYLLDILEFLP